MSMPTIESIQVSLPQAIGDELAADPMDQRWYSGFHKRPVSGPVRVGKLTIAGDGQADLSVHGGPDRPILAYCADHYESWRDELGFPDKPFGGFGENFTIRGLNESRVCLGDVYGIDGVRVEVSQPRQPCWKLARRWRNKELPALVIKHHRGGWYFRVLTEGMVEAGMSVQLLERPHAHWTIVRMNHMMYHGKDDVEANRELAACLALSVDWREYFAKRLAGELE